MTIELQQQIIMTNLPTTHPKKTKTFFLHRNALFPIHQHVVAVVIITVPSGMIQKTTPTTIMTTTITTTTTTATLTISGNHLWDSIPSVPWRPIFKCMSHSTIITVAVEKKEHRRHLIKIHKENLKRKEGEKQTMVEHSTV